MLRTGASRLVIRAIAAPASRAPGPSIHRAEAPLKWTAQFTQFSSVPSRRPRIPALSQLKPLKTTIVQRSMADKIDREAESRYQHQKIEPHPERVTTTSTITPMVGQVGDQNQQPEPEHDAIPVSGMRHDLNTIKETFDMSSVPRQAYYLGLAGVLPYLGTSLSTVACAYEINHADAGYGYFLSAHTAETLLHLLEPLQIGYGAVILSFLGAIHWGLEWAGYGGYQGYRRYAIGVVAPAIAWPTVLMPVEYALISQFCAFILLYYADTRATYRGWTPPWYAIYRFVLTFIVGASIVVSLVGRGEIADRIGRLPGAVDRMKTLGEDAQQKLAEEEKAIRAQDTAKAEAAESGRDKERETA
ncbi:hypothetical protein CC78DRAFT_223275 [Lojkania enalia]|uniref:Mitochondrial inner membrane protein 1 n=1 Tax=Lojkania enalia TaxID=147567 RepID=A0A9P4K895_9PLEO|nr:hypothetical protein CC78DRAFT_223275 [Didymosphaeria enalia]